MPIALDDVPRALLTDLYEITMAAAYDESGVEAWATFEVFVRELPAGRSFLLAAGLEHALDYLTGFRIRPEEIDYLRSLPIFARVQARFFERLGGLRFTGEVWAMPEGTPFFAGEPLLRVTAPILEAQIIETFLLTILNFESLIATKAARVVRAAAGRPVVDFGARRAHGPEASVLAARAAFLGGCLGTSNLYAGWRFGIPVYGTQAHSFVLAFEREEESFEAFHRVFPEHTVLLIDTYDTLAGARKATALGKGLRGVRLDSGDLLTLSREVRWILDQAGLSQTKIFASGDLNEFRIEHLVAEGAPIDFFGVGTDLVTSRDEPALGAVYKLAEEEREGRVRYVEKLSPGKATYAGKKQVWRLIGERGHYREDVMTRAMEPAPAPGAEPLLSCVMRDGRRLAPHPSLAKIRERGAVSIERLPEGCLALRGGAAYPVRPSAALKRLRDEIAERAGSEA